MCEFESNFLEVLVGFSVFDMLLAIHVHDIVECAIFQEGNILLHFENLLCVLFVRGRDVALNKDYIDGESLGKPPIRQSNELSTCGRPKGGIDTE